MKKIYCKDCKYCGEFVKYYPAPPVDMDTIAPHREYNNKNIKHIIEYDTFYKHIKYYTDYLAHVINKNNDCKYFEPRGEVI